MFNKKIVFFSLVIVWLLFPVFSYADVHDRGIRYAKVKSEYDLGKGTGSNWLHLKYSNNGLYGNEGCLFDANSPGVFSKCPGRAGLGDYAWIDGLQDRDYCGGSSTRIGDSWLGCLSYDSSPYFSINSPSNSYWVIHANNEPSFDQCREGPPSLSEEISNHSFQTEKLFNVSSNLYSYPYWHELKIKINASQYNFNCNGQFEHSIPFLSIGSHYGHGNPNYLGTLNRNGTGEDNLKFSMRISDYTPFTCNDVGCHSTNIPGAYAGFFVSAEWSNPANPSDPSVVYPKFAWIPLFGDGFFDGYTSGIGASKWNWPIYDSMFWPGAAIGGMGADKVTSDCSGVTIPSLNTNGTWSTYNIDLTKLYECLGDSPNNLLPPLPNGNINIIGVHFMMEAGHASEGELEVALRNIRID
ncbi:MAG: hypothetical protein ACK5L8_02935 [Marinicella pacifica]